MKTLNQLTYTGDSEIHGQGLFARESIHKDDVIGRVQGNPCAGDGTYVLWLNEDQAIRVNCNLKYINHSEQPNACYYDDMTVMALRDISQNEEITHNYGAVDW